MSPRWLIVLALLQAVTLAVLGLLVVRSVPEEPGGELREFEVQLAGALHHQLELVQYLDLLRNDLDRLVQELGAGSGDPTARPGGDVVPPAAPPADVPFPEAHRHLQSLKDAFVQRAAAAGGDQNFLQPFDLRIAEEKENLLRRGADSLHWIHEELDLQPAQQDSIRAVLERWRPAMDSAWAEVRPRLETVRARIRSDIAAQLTEEQRVQYEAMGRAHAERHQRGPSGR